ncbi:MAG TPA: hypothetical protein VGL73_13250 [Caulobacteraceae bacterium]|jgi:hypothetical protein
MTITNSLILPAILLAPRELIATPDGVATALAAIDPGVDAGAGK